MSSLPRKGYARIYVAHPDDVPKVEAIIKELDAFEHEYLPTGLVAPYTEWPRLVYTHKFDGLCMNRLMGECWKRGIHAWVCDNGKVEYMSDTGEPIHLT